MSFIVPTSNYLPIRDLWVGRLGLPTVETPIGELLGSEVQTTGDATVVGQRRVKGFTMTWPIHGTTGDANPYASGQRMRRQLRSMMQNHIYRLSGVYVMFTFDPERNGWMVIGTANLEDKDGGATLAEYALTIDNAYRVAAINTHLDAYRIEIVDLRLSYSVIDYEGAYVNATSMFASTAGKSIPALPVGATNPRVLGAACTLGSRASADGPVPIVLTKLPSYPGLSASPLATGDVVAWERDESSMGLGDVIIYDRRGSLGPFGPNSYDIVNFCPNPRFAHDVINSAPALWVTTGDTGHIGGSTGGAVQTVIQRQGVNVNRVITTGLNQSSWIPLPGRVFQNGQVVQCSVQLQGNVGGEKVTVRFGDEIQDFVSTNVTLTTGVTTVTLTWTTTHVERNVALALVANQAASQTFYVSNAIIGGTAYVDGDQVGYRWNGTPGQASSSADPQFGYGWEEVYGTDYPYSWLKNGIPDAPVIQNGLCRVRFDTSNTDGFRIDTWDGWTYVEQGKATFSSAATFVSAQVDYWTPDRGVIEVVLLDASANPIRIVVSLQRGWTGPRFEMYGAGANPDFHWSAPLSPVEINDSVIKYEAGGSAVIISSAAQSAAIPTGVVGTSGFGGPNDFALLREGASHQANFAIVQNNQLQTERITTPYGGATNGLWVGQSPLVPVPTPGYNSIHMGFAPQATDQVIEAESIINLSGTTNSQAQALASAGFAVQDSQTTAAAASAYKAATNLLQATYRIFARVRCTANSGIAGSFFASLGGVNSNTVITSVTVFTWFDFGEVTAPSAAPSLAMTGWRSAGAAGSVLIDRIELVLAADTTRPSPGYYGSHGLGQQALYDQRVQTRRVARA